MRIQIIHQQSNSCTLLKIAGKMCLFLVSRILPKQEGHGVWLGHHTYFKPTGLVFLSKSEILQCKTVAFEEGIGTYGSVKHHRTHAVANRVKWSGLKAVIRKVLRGSLFVDERERLLIGEDSQDMSDVLDYLGRTFYEQEVLEALNERTSDLRCTMFVGSPYVEAGQVKQEEYITLLRKVMESSKDHVVFAKPHPLEVDCSSYVEVGMKLIPRRLPGEIAVALLAPVDLIGCGSGLLITGGMMEGVRAFDVSDFFVTKTRHSLGFVGTEFDRLLSDVTRGFPSGNADERG